MAVKPTVLIVEDDLRLRSLLQRRFHIAGADVLTAAGMVDAQGILHAFAPAAAVVDIGLEDSNGMDLVAELAGQMLVLVMTGSRDVELLRRALALGAADVVFKPFDDAELAIRVLARLAAGVAGSDVAGSGIAACLERGSGRELRCTLEERSERLSVREDLALDLLLAARGHAVDRDTLSRTIYGEPWDPGSRRVDALVARLRRKLHCDRCGAQRALNTVHNVGYRFDGRIRFSDEVQ